MAGSIAVSAWYFDLSFDGEWYHQTAVYAIARDWNPLTDPMRSFLPHLQLWVRHYAKGPWYVAAAIYQTTGNVEAGKCTTLLACVAMGLAVFAAGLDCGLRRRRAAALALVVALNPVVMSELTTYLVDGVMIGFLVVAVAAIFSGFLRSHPIVVWVGVLAAIASINATFTGLVFLCFVFAAGWLWCAILHRGWLLRYTGWTALALKRGVAVLPGALTPSEVMAACKAAADFILAGAAALGIGQHLIHQNAIKRRQREWIHELARRYMGMVSDARSQLAT
ncbi:MAG: hypothetical protein WBQ65_04660 [Bryobacteraceae bacterium]